MARRPAVHLTNVHPAGRICEICKAPIVTGQGGYVASTGKATHVACPRRAEEEGGSDFPPQTFPV